MKWQVTIEKTGMVTETEAGVVKTIVKNVHPGDHGSFVVTETGEGDDVQGEAVLTKAGKNSSMRIASCEKYAGRFG